LFNEALSIYLSQEPKNPSGQYWYNIGNVFFYIGDYGRAIAMYRCAQLQLPRDPRVMHNLQLAIESAGVKNLQLDRPIADTAGLRWCSSFERSLFFLGLCGMTLVSFSLNVWLPSAGFRWIWKWFFVLTICWVGLIAWYDFCIPSRAVVVQAVSLQTSPADSEGGITTLSPGEMVEILSADPKNSWVRARTVFGITGYVSGSTLFFVT
jgi:hypothetical protein